MIEEVLSLESIKNNSKMSVFIEPFFKTIKSATRPDRFYFLSCSEGFTGSITCECEAYLNNRPVCWHRTRVEEDLKILSHYIKSVVKLLTFMRISNVSKSKLYEYMEIQYLYTDNSYSRSVIKNHKDFVFKNLWGKLNE